MTQTFTLRAYANLPTEVPEALLDAHLAGAEAELKLRVGVDTAPPLADLFWQEAITVRALNTVLPWLNTFALDGAAKVGRLEGTVEFRFLTPDDVAARAASLGARFDELVSVLRAALPINAAAATFVTAGGFTFDAV